MVGKPLTLPVPLQDPTAVVASGELDSVGDGDDVTKPEVGMGEGVMDPLTDPLPDKL